MDRITKALLESFKKEQSFTDTIQEPFLFEHFANYCIVSGEYSNSFDIDNIHVGGGQDMAIDGIAIIVNNKLVSSIEEVKDLIDTNKYLDVLFVFLQSKISSHFDTGDIAKFLLGVKSFFDDDNLNNVNLQIQEKLNIMNYIYKNSRLFSNRKPNLKLFYITTGTWNNDKNILSTVENLKEPISNLSLFDEVFFDGVGANELQELYRYADNRISREIQFDQSISLPQTKNVEQSSIVILPATEYIKLIVDDSDNLIEGLFYDNIRGYQGENEVNQEIAKTIDNKDEHDAFILYNNGITIVAEKFIFFNRKLQLSDYQVVNGCQTSYVLYNKRKKVSSQLFIAIRIIQLQGDSEFKKKIIQGNNRQTPVKLTELEALNSFQVKLEEYYSSYQENSDHRLYYERRPRQYNGIGREIEKIRIIDINTQIRCFASMFLNQANNSGRYAQKLRESVKNKIFQDEHPKIAYYASAYALFRLDSCFRKGLIDGKYKPFRYHFLNLVRLYSAGEKMPEMCSKKFEKYCTDIETILHNSEQCFQIFKKCSDVIDSIVNDNFNGNYERSDAKTVKFLTLVNSEWKKHI